MNENTQQEVPSPPDHWENYWLDSSEQDIAGLKYSQVENYLNQIYSVDSSDEQDIMNAAATAEELYLSLGPDNEMGNSHGFMMLLAARVLNGAAGREFISEDGIQSDFSQDKIAKIDAISNVEKELMAKLTPTRNPETMKAMTRDIKSMDPEKLLLVCNILSDASRHASKPEDQRSTDLVNQHLLRSLISRETPPSDSDQEEAEKMRNKAKAIGLYYDIRFSAKQREGAVNFDDYSELMKDYARDVAPMMTKMPNGAKFELFVPFIARYSAWYEGRLGSMNIYQSTERSDAPHDNRSRRSPALSHSSDIIVVDTAGRNTKYIQLKADLNPHHNEYDETVVDVFHGGLAEVIELLPDPKMRNEMRTYVGSLNAFISSLFIAVSEAILADTEQSSLVSDKSRLKFSDRYGFEAEAALELLQELYSAELEPKAASLV